MDFLQKSIYEYEKEVEFLLKYQIKDVNNPDFGGYYNKEQGIIPQNGGAAAAKPIAVYFCPASKYYKNPQVLDCADGLVQHLLNHLHEDGTVDYFSCNFHSAPDTGFVTLSLAKAAKLIKAENEQEEAFKSKLYKALQQMGEGMIHNGFHTPNHRWVISAALALVNTLMPNQKYLDRINEYLAEEIDCNEDGEYTERSAGGYNEINNRALLLLAQELGKTEYLEYVERNLELMLAFYHSDFSIFTENSTRQDKGTKVYADRYVYQYMLCGAARGNQRLRSIGVTLLQSCIDGGRPFPLAVEDLMLFPEAFENLPKAADKDIFTVNRHLKDSGLLRLSKAGMNLWAVENQPSFLFLKAGDIDFYIKGGISFFNCRHLTFTDMEEKNGSYHLQYEGKGHYYKPFGEYKGTTDWEVIGHHARETTGHQFVKVSLVIIPEDEGYKLDIATEGCPDSTIRFEIGMMPNVLVRGEGYRIAANAGGNLIADKGDVTLFDGRGQVSIGPAFAANDITQGLVGAVPPSQHRFNVFFNDTTNFKRTLFIRAI